VIHPLESSISRDPKIFHDLDIWNPMRWLESKYPTYQEPLSKFPTITGYSQSGYGRRTCQGMGVTEADLFVGLGSMVWMFSMCQDTEADTNTTLGDRTMEYSTILIAKPKPSKFNLEIRDKEKADRVTRRWIEQKMGGEFADSRVYWKDGNKGDQQYVWGEVLS
jgi:hypothetical protein